MNMVVNKDGKQTVIIEQISSTRVNVLFLGTNIIKEYSLKDFQTGNTSDVIKVTGGKTFTQVHIGEIRTMKDGNKAKIVGVADEDKHIVSVEVKNGAKFNVPYVDFYNGVLVNNKEKKAVPKKAQTSSNRRSNAVEATANAYEALYGDAVTKQRIANEPFYVKLETYCYRKGYKFLKPTGNPGEYKLFGVTISELRPYMDNGKFTFNFKVSTKVGIRFISLDMAIKSALNKGCNSQYFQDALHADKFLTGGWYTRQFWLRMAAEHRAGNLNPKMGVKPNCAEFRRAQKELGRTHAYVEQDRPADKEQHALSKFVGGITASEHAEETMTLWSMLS